MMCYRDMTFCPYYKDCSNADSCHRVLTPEVLESADKWWGKQGAPIAVFTEQPECHTTKPKGDTNERHRT